MAVSFDLHSSITELARGSAVVMLFTLTLILSVTVMFTRSVYSGSGAPSGSHVSSIAFVAVAVVFISAVVLWQCTRISTRDAFIAYDDLGLEGDRRAMRNLNAATLELRMRKTDVMLPAIASFFCSGSPRLTELSATTFRVFWQPSASDMSGQFLKGGEYTPWTIDDVSCSDRVSKLPMDAMAHPEVDAVVRDAANPVDCRVFIDDGVYVCNKAALSMWAEVVNSSVLRLKTAHVGTQTLMLLRPCLVRVGGATTRLFRVEYGAPGHDGNAFDSADASKTHVTLRLSDASRWDDRGSFDPPSAGTTTVVCYYLSYQMPRAALQGHMSVKMHAATAVVAGGHTPTRDTGGLDKVHVSDVMGIDGWSSPVSVPVLTLTAYRDIATVTAGGQTFRMPAGSRATIATYTADAIVAAAVFDDRVVLRRFQPLRRECNYIPVNNGGVPRTNSGISGISDISSITTSAIPNLADFATRVRGLGGNVVASVQLGALALASAGASDAARLLLSVPDAPPTTSNTLLAYPKQCLPAGRHITSANGKFVVAYNRDGSLGVQKKTPDTNCAGTGGSGSAPSDFDYTWSSQTAKVVSKAALAPGLARIDAASGVITLQDARGTTYWRSSLTPLPADARPYRMVASDTGSIEVWGAFGGGPYWTRSGGNGNAGYALFDTCELASAAYADANAAAILASTLGGRVTVTPWIHYRYRGGRDMGLHWPGAHCEA